MGVGVEAAWADSSSKAYERKAICKDQKHLHRCREVIVVVDVHHRVFVTGSRKRRMV